MKLKKLVNAPPLLFVILNDSKAHSSSEAIQEQFYRKLKKQVFLMSGEAIIRKLGLDDGAGTEYGTKDNYTYSSRLFIGSTHRGGRLAV